MSPAAQLNHWRSMGNQAYIISRCWWRAWRQAGCTYVKNPNESIFAFQYHGWKSVSTGNYFEVIDPSSLGARGTGARVTPVIAVVRNAPLLQLAVLLAVSQPRTTHPREVIPQDKLLGSTTQWSTKHLGPDGCVPSIQEPLRRMGRNGR
jgi:hypothetical protein